MSFHDPWQLMNKPINIDAVFQAQLLEDRTMFKARPNDPVGDYTIDGEIFLGGIFIKHIF